MLRIEKRRKGTSLVFYAPGRACASGNERPVHLGPAVPDAVDLVLAGDLDDALRPRQRGVDLRDDHLRRVLAGLGQDGPVEVEDAAAPDEAEAALLADAVDGGVVDVVLHRP